MVYGSRWNSTMRFMIDTVSEDEARRRFTNGPWFSVAIGDGLATSAEQSRAATAANIALPVPEFTLELEPGPSDVNTFFYNEQGSIVAIYQFRRHDEQTLFLHEAVFYFYPDEPRYFGQNECLVVDSVEFHLDGTSRSEHNDRSKPMIDVTDRCDVDLAMNWEPIPTFGDWTSLGRADRRPVIEPDPMQRRPW
jgi:hypothetical protein